MTGIRPTFGGYHTTQGTKNAVVNLGEGRYLELLAIDEDNVSIPAPRWMGVDFLEKPHITRWSLKSNDLLRDSNILKTYQGDMGKVQGGQRKMTNGKLLTWEMSMPLSSPQVEIIPFMTDWQQSEVHPTDSMPEEFQFIGLQFFHPAPPSVAEILKKLGVEGSVIKGAEIAIKMKMNTPKGVVEI